MTTREEPAADVPTGTRWQTLAVPLALGVFLVGGAGTLFRPAFTVEAPAHPTVVAPARSAAKPDITAARANERDGEQPATLTTGRSVNVPNLSLTPDEVTRLFERGRAALASGDFAAARLLLARAAGAGHAEAMYALASTYDPNVLSAKGARGLVGDPEQAKALYERALNAGVADARARIAALNG